MKKGMATAIRRSFFWTMASFFPIAAEARRKAAVWQGQRSANSQRNRGLLDVRGKDKVRHLRKNFTEKEGARKAAGFGLSSGHLLLVWGMKKEVPVLPGKPEAEEVFYSVPSASLSTERLWRITCSYQSSGRSPSGGVTQGSSS